VVKAESWIHPISFVVKLIVSVAALIYNSFGDVMDGYWKSGLDHSFKFLVLFLKEGGFQNLGISVGLAIDYLLNYESPDVDVPLEPF
jgi:hypothetical protein